MDLSALNDKQQEAVTAPLGPVLVLAGAGSGKTRVLTSRIAWLIEQGLVPAGNVLAVTFTNKAAKEMQGRVQQLLHSKISISNIQFPTMGTFHSLGARMLRQDITALGYTRGFVIFDDDDQLKVIKELCQELGISQKFPPSLFRAYIGHAKNALQTPGEMKLGIDPSLEQLVRQIYARYQDYLFRQNAVDFDDLLLLPIKILELRPEILARYRRQFGYILVDEYQDTNHAQYIFLKLLAAHRNLFVVGDDAQSIYGFRGSNIMNILTFEQDYPEALVVKLEQNYRSTKHILAAAQKVIELNSEQKPKVLWTENESGPKVRVEEVENEYAEARFVAERIIAHAGGNNEEEEEIIPEPESRPFSILDHFIAQSHRGRAAGIGRLHLPRNHGDLTQFAVLYRTHSQSRALEEVFIESGIPYQIVGGVRFYERKEIKDVLAFVRLVVNHEDLVSLKRVVNVPSRGIGEKAYQVLKAFILGRSDDARESLSDFQTRLELIKLPPKQKEAARGFFAMLGKFGALPEEQPLSDLLRLIVKVVGLERWLKDGSEQGEERWENVEELFNVAAKFDHVPWQEGVMQFLEEVSLVTAVDSMEDKKDTVTMMTLHSAKGLEFDTVFFVGLEEGILPHSRSLLNPSELAEEIRLAYVGLTRARKRLYLVYARTRSVFGSMSAAVPSRILKALPKEAVDMRGAGNLRSAAIEIKDGLTYEPIDF